MTVKLNHLKPVSASENLTLVAETYRKKRHNHRIIFGDPVTIVRRGWRRKFAAFKPDQIFAYERWTGNKYGTQTWSLLIGQALRTPPQYPVDGVTPGVDVLLYVKGKIQVLRTLAALDVIRDSSLNLADISPDRWRLMHNVILGGGDPAYLLADWV